MNEELSDLLTDAAMQMPCNIEAEQALLGAILYDGQGYERLPEGFESSHLYEPFHKRLFDAMEVRLIRGDFAEPIMVMDVLRDDPALHELGGLGYLADLVDRAPPVAGIRDFAKIISGLALRRELIRVGGAMIHTAHKTEDTPEELLSFAEHAVFALGADTSAGQGLKGIGVGLDLALETAEAALNRGGAIVGVATGLIDLDRKLGGLHPSDLVILAGRPSMGKTALATNVALNAAKAGSRVGFFSLEMSREQLAMRLACEVSGVTGDRVRRGDIDMEELYRLREARDRLRELPLEVDESGALQIAKLAARARRMKRMGGLDLVIVDYLQLVTGAREDKGNRVQEVSSITAALKALAKDLAVPVLALSQLSRQVESRDDKRPMLSDLRESGSIEQDADVVMFVYREAYYLGRQEPPATSTKHAQWCDEMSEVQGLAEVIIAKQRHGPIGTVRLAFDENLTRFGNLAREAYARDPYGSGA